MDSGNSGSMSSSGEEEYDSRSDMIPPFLNNPHPPQFASFPFLPPPPPPHHHQPSLHHAPPIFDIPPNNYHLQSLSSSSSQTHHHPTPFLNLDLDTPPTTDSHHHHHHHQHPPSQPFINSAAPSSLHNDDHNNAPAAAAPSNAPSVRNPSKKRSRASRRAPTTVLTTDTSNFRAMVQEFTGIPSPPSSTSTSYSRRLHLLTTPTPHGHHPPFHPLRPPSSSSSTLMLHNHHLPVPPSSTSLSLNYPTETVASYNNLPQNTLTMQILPFQTTPTTTLHSFNNNDTNPSLHDVGFSGKSTQPNSSMPSSIEDQMGMGLDNAHLMNVVPPHVRRSSEADGHDIGGNANKDQVRPFHVAAPCKINFSAGASSSAAAPFNADKTFDNNSTAARGEGNIESWICSSD